MTIIATTTETCPCGQEVFIDWIRDERQSFDFFEGRCEHCGRTPTAGNTRTRDITDWITARSAASAEANFAAQQFSAECNEWMGRGNHPF